MTSLALVVEVNHHSSKADNVVKLRRYAQTGVPVYWVVDALGRSVSVHERPLVTGRTGRYATIQFYESGRDFPIVIDGAERGRVAVDDLFPPKPK